MAFFLPLLAAGTALGAASAYMSGKQQAKGAAAQAAAARLEAGNARLRSTQIAELSRENLHRTLGAMDIIRAGRGVKLDSATGQALERRTVDSAYRNEAVARLGELNRATAADWQAKGYSRQAKWALPMSMLNFAGNAATTWAGSGAFD